MRCVRSIRETRASLFVESIQPLVSGFFADAVRIAKRGHGISATLRFMNKLFADSHEIGCPPRHDNLQSVRARESESN